uniref:Uncharacterized protein n=1 Tax=Triticum urartu TaxID=4572 RepID=A0A8R7V375_TRIUA
MAPFTRPAPRATDSPRVTPGRYVPQRGLVLKRVLKSLLSWLLRRRRRRAGRPRPGRGAAAPPGRRGT